jgi:hypothetical protein
MTTIFEELAMFKSSILTNRVGLTRRLLPLVGLAFLLFLLMPTLTLADSPVPCVKCHNDEMKAWEGSPHAQAAPAVNCEDCHGAYVEGHPKDGIMQLGVDSASCQKCHTETYKQWQNSAHGQASVQCISCHLSHSQEFRLTDETLCTPCHEQLNDFNHATHAEANLACTDCHVSSVAHGPAQANTPPDHSFVVASQMCVDCHEQAGQSAFRPAIAAKVVGNASPELTAKLKTAEKTNEYLKGMSFGSLGLGIGIGGMLGIIFMLVIGTLNCRSKK